MSITTESGAFVRLTGRLFATVLIVVPVPLRRRKVGFLLLITFIYF